MAPKTTELVVLPLAPTVDSNDKGTVENVFATLKKQNGYMEAFYGTQFDELKNFTGIIEWEDVTNHEEFQATEDYKPFIAALQAILAGAPKLVHVHFDKDISIFENAPVVQILTFYLPSDIDKAAWANAWSPLVDSAEGAKGYIKNTAGWVIEDVEHENFEGKTGKAFVAAIGWESMDEYWAFVKSQAHEDGAVEGRKLAKGLEQYFLKLTKA